MLADHASGCWLSEQDLASGIALLTSTAKKVLTKMWEGTNSNSSGDPEETESMQNTSGNVLPFKQGAMEKDDKHLAGSLQDLVSSAKLGERIINNK